MGNLEDEDGEALRLAALAQGDYPCRIVSLDGVG